MTTEVDLTTDAYRRWLRAECPPLPWFLTLSQVEQEAMAGLGDEHRAAVHGRLVDELLMRLDMAAAQAQAMQRPATEPRWEAPATMAGIRERQEAQSVAEQDRRNRTKRFLGRKPDEPVPVAQMAPVTTEATT